MSICHHRPQRPTFAMKKIIDTEEFVYDTGDDAFTTINTFLLLKLNYSLFEQIANVNPNFKQEFDVLTTSMDDGSNSLFQRFMELQGYRQ
jgi:hypothetical protein